MPPQPGGPAHPADLRTGAARGCRAGSDQRLACSSAVATFGSLRYGEATALRRADVEPDGSVIRV